MPQYTVNVDIDSEKTLRFRMAIITKVSGAYYNYLTVNYVHQQDTCSYITS